MLPALLLLAVSVTPPTQFLIDKDTEVAAIVTVTRAETRWVILPDGDHVPLVLAGCVMEEPLRPNPMWPKGTSQSVMQLDYTDLVSQAMAPPVMEGRRYLLWATPSSPDSELPREAPWLAHPQGFLLIRGHGDAEFVYWGGKCYSVAAIRDALRGGAPIPLDQIVDPRLRIRIARERLERGDLGDEAAFIRGLMANVLDPEAQARNVQPATTAEPDADTFGLEIGGARPHALWYESLALLRDLGRDERYRPAVVSALEPVALTARDRVRLAAALALVDLGSDAGRECLVENFEDGEGQVSADPPDSMSFPGRYAFDDSTPAACAHALARLGDPRGLQHADLTVRLAAAEALVDRPDDAWREVLRQIASELAPKVEELRSNGSLAAPRRPGDYTIRYPDAWVRTHGLLARAGSAEDLRLLVDAWLADLATYPNQATPLLPRAQVATWSSGPSLASAIANADAQPARLLSRLHALYGGGPSWDQSEFRALRGSLGAPSQAGPVAELPESPAAPTEAELLKRLASAEADDRAQALAAAGYHNVVSLYQRVLGVAEHGTGIERQAAIYALGFYRREPPEPTLRLLLTDSDPGVRLSAVELATRTDPTRFASEALAALRAELARPVSDRMQALEREQSVKNLTRVLSRLTRGPLPKMLVDGLQDPDPLLRLVIAQVLGMGGNPQAVVFLMPLLRDDDLRVREAAQRAIDVLGPPGD